MKVEKIIDNYFINLSPKKLPMSFYLIRKSLLEAVSELKPKIHGQVLDLACGIMPYKHYLANESIQSYVGIDLEPSEYHNSVKPDFYWDGKTIPFEENTFDFVIATEFLEHYFDTNHILKEIHRVLKPGGTFFFTVPAVWPIHEAPYDYHRFTPFSLEEHFKKVQFSSSEIKPLGGFNYYFALSIAIWNDFKISKTKQKLIKPFLTRAINFLVKKDIKNNKLDNGQLFSGLYGFVVK